MKKIDNLQKAQYIDEYLISISKKTLPTSLSHGIKFSSDLEDEEIRELEFTIEELGLVTLVAGRDNSTLEGFCEYVISNKGRRFLTEGKSSLILMKGNTIIEDALVKEFLTNPIFDKKVWDKHYDAKFEKRADEADIYIDLILSENLLNLDKATIRKYFKKWYSENAELDLQIENGVLLIEDGEIQTVPRFEKNDVAKFLLWFNKEKSNFVDYLKSEGIFIATEPVTSNSIVNSGNMIINQNTKIKKQSQNETDTKESGWSKANIIITAIISIASVAVAIWAVYK